MFSKDVRILQRKIQKYERKVKRGKIPPPPQQKFHYYLRAFVGRNISSKYVRISFQNTIPFSHV